jgi:hypothetical protein
MVSTNVVSAARRHLAKSADGVRFANTGPQHLEKRHQVYWLFAVRGKYQVGRKFSCLQRRLAVQLDQGPIYRGAADRQTDGQRRRSAHDQYQS